MSQDLPGCSCTENPSLCSVHNPTREKPAHGVIVPVVVRQAQIVELHWRLSDGRVYIERRTCPPSATVEVRASTEREE